MKSKDKVMAIRSINTLTFVLPFWLQKYEGDFPRACFGIQCYETGVYKDASSISVCKNL